MASGCRIAILSDIHYAGAAEQARGDDYEFHDIHNPFARLFVKNYRHYIWLRHPLQQNHRLDHFFERVGEPDIVVANGDYTCDSAFTGVADDAALESARDCLEKLRARFGSRFHAGIGDHELGKKSFYGDKGGMRVASFHRVVKNLRLSSLWRHDAGRYTLLGVTSSLIALPVYAADALASEMPEWERLREQHMAEIRAAFATIEPDRRILLFCHDPTALPFLLREESVRARLPQIENTVIGHLHSRLIFWKSRVLAGMPPLKFLGHTARRLTTALSEARNWRPFHVKLCPALAGIQLLKDGGYLTVDLDLTGNQPAQFHFHRLR